MRKGRCASDGPAVAFGQAVGGDHIPARRFSVFAPNRIGIRAHEAPRQIENVFQNPLRIRRCDQRAGGFHEKRQPLFDGLLLPQRILSLPPQLMFAI